MEISRSFTNICIRALTESMDTSTMVHLAKEFYPNYDLNDRAGFPPSLSVPNVDAARQIIRDIMTDSLGIEFVTLLIDVQDHGWKGRHIEIKHIREIIKELFGQGYLYDKESRSFMENPRVRKSRNWGVLAENREYNFTFLRVDIEDSSKIVRKHSKEKIQKVFADFRDIVLNAVESRTGRIWSWEGDGGLASFYYGNKDSGATLAAMEILHGVFLYNRLDNPLDQPVSLRIAVHSGKCEYLTRDEELKKAEPVKKIHQIEKDSTPGNHILITVVVKEMLDTIIASQFHAHTHGGNHGFVYSLELAR